MHKALQLRVPPLLLTLIVAALMLLSHHIIGGSIDSGLIGLSLGLALGALGLAMAGAGFLSFLLRKTTPNPIDVHAASELVTNGLYRISRNPMYLGMLLLLAGLAVYLGNALSFVLCGAFVWYLNEFQIKPEEHAMENLFGAQFIAYRARVRRWI